MTDWGQFVNRARYDDLLRMVPPTIKFVKTLPGAVCPTASYPGDAGYDLYAAQEIHIPVGEWRDVPIGICVEPPEGYWIRIVGRSSTFRRRGLLVIEGVIDNGYRGDIFFGVHNFSGTAVIINPGDRIAQAILHPILRFDWQEVDELTESRRGGAGFGSTGN